MMTADYRMLAEQLYLSQNTKNGLVPNKTIERYKVILTNGLNGTTENEQQIVIVGAGISGLLSAILLADFGHKITLLEANGERVGGRIKTFGHTAHTSPFTAGQYAEAGAMRFPAIHPLLMAYIEIYGLSDKKQPFFNVAVEDPNGDPIVKVNNTLLRCNSFEERRSSYALDPSKTNARFYQDSKVKLNTSGTLLDAALDCVRDLYSRVDNNGERYDFDDYEEWINGWASVIQLFDKHTLGSYLRETACLDKGTIDLIGTIENLTSRMPLSFIHSFLSRSDINPNNVYYELQGGSWQLTQVLLDKINNDYNGRIAVKMGHRMTHIDYFDTQNRKINAGAPENHAQDEDGKRLSIRTIDENNIENDHIQGDLAIITIPFSSLRFVRTDPDFSYGKRRAIMELHYDAATKVLLEFNKRWWEFTDEQWVTELEQLKNDGEISQIQLTAYLEELKIPYEEGGKPALHAFGGGSITDNPNRGMYYPSHQVLSSSQALPGGVILASYTWSDDARRWDSMPDEDRYEFALRGLALVHGYRIRHFFVGKKNNQWIKDLNGKISKGVATQSWARSPYAFGEAAVFQAYQLTNLHPSIPTPEGPVFFAGEHTSLKHAWIEGALESAIRVALEVKDKVD
jgi:monoamine oxidase